MNYLIHPQTGKDGIKYLRLAHDDINQLIELVESYRDTINSTRGMYMANVSLQLNDPMRILTIFSVILSYLTLMAGIYEMSGLDLSHLYLLGWLCHSDFNYGRYCPAVTAIL